MPEIFIDTEISFKEIDYIFLNILNFFEPFGPGNQVPIFLSKNMEISGPIRVLRNNTHIFKLADKNNDISFDAIFPVSGDYHDNIIVGAVCDVCYSIDVFQWNGKLVAKLKVKDLKFL